MLIDFFRNLLKGLENDTPRLLDEKNMFTVCDRVKKLFMEESNVVEINPPVVICGDIHGQFFDLLHLFEQGGSPIFVNYLFLGDYVDRGRYSIETIQYLFLLKILYPHRITLLRGNHECQKVSRFYGFYDECLKKYGSASVWRYCMDAFSYMALFALIEDRFFCVHGGLSPSCRLIDQMRVIDRFGQASIPEFLEDFVWSDPEAIQGWGANPRGAGWLFGCNVVDEFRHLNDTELIIRSHQLVMEGYKYMFPPKKTLLTIWSAPNYCYRCGNLAAILHLDAFWNKKFITFQPAYKSLRMSLEI